MQSLASDPPSDVLGEICAFLSPKRPAEFVTAASLNRRWRDFICDEKRHWKLEIGVRTDATAAERVALMRGSSLLRVHVRVCALLPANVRNTAADVSVAAADAVCAALCHLPRLHTLTCTFQLSDAQLRSLKACAGLRRLERGASGEWVESELAVLAAEPPWTQLECVNRGAVTPRMALALEKLVGLRELEPWWIHPDALASIARLPRLEALRVCIHNGRSQRLPHIVLMPAIGHLGGTLHTLALEQMKLSSTQLSEAVAAFPLLTNLTVSNLPPLEDLQWLNSARALVSLYLGECPAIVSSADPLDLSPTLTSVTFSEVPTLHLACLSRAAALHTLRLDTCPSLTFDSLCALAPIASLRALSISIYPGPRRDHRGVPLEPDPTLTDFLSAKQQAELRSRMPQLSSFAYSFEQDDDDGPESELL